MRHEVFVLRSADGLRLCGQSWLPEGEPRATGTLVHGIGEHTGRYGDVAAHLTRAGLALIGADLRGHGCSEGPRGHISSWDILLNDVKEVLDYAAQLFPDKPLFLFGHSLGGTLVLTYGLRRHAAGLAGIIASAPQLRLAFRPAPWLKLLGQLAYNWVPGFSQKSGLDVNALSRDPKVAEAYRKDRLVHDLVSARLGMDLIREGGWALDNADQWPADLPLLIMHGTADRLTRCEASREFAEQVGSACTMIPWEGLYHELHNEPEREQVLDALLAWIDEHVVRQ